MVKITFTLIFSIVCFKCKIIHCEDATVDLCVKNNSDIDYSEYTTMKSSSCDCKNMSQCIRKCCQYGFFHNFTREDNEDGKCIRNNSMSFTNFTVSLYELSSKISETNVFIIGMLNCNNSNTKHQYFKMNNHDPNEKYFLQTNGYLYYPKSQKMFYSNDRYCVDEEDGLSVYLCYTPENSQKVVSRLLNSTGI